MALSIRAVEPDASDLPTFSAPADIAEREQRAVERENRATEWMLAALATISKRALIALAAIEHLILAGSVFALWLRIAPQPTNPQLIAGSIYSAFVLAFLFARKR